MPSSKSSSLYKILKISSDKITSDKKSKEDNPEYKVKEQTYEESIVNGEVISIIDNQVLHKIRDYHKEHEPSNTPLLNVVDDLVNIVVPTDNAKNDYTAIAKNNFTFNGVEYKRLCSGSGQIRKNTITFIRKTLYEYLFESLCCGLIPNDFGNDFNTAKFNAYFGLNMSGVRFLKDAPHICIVDDFEEIRPHMQINYVETSSKEKNITKDISNPFYDDKKDDGDYRFSALNSFDGQGLCDPEYAKKTALELGFLKADGEGYLPSQYIIRAPWIKGLIVTFDWKSYCKQCGLTMLKDIFGEIHNIKDIDLLISKSQFKMWKIYSKKGGWNYYVKSMKKYNLKWGIVMPNKEFDDNVKALNYQYINALSSGKNEENKVASSRLTNDEINSLCSISAAYLEKLCNGDAEKIYRALIETQPMENSVTGDDCSDETASTTTQSNYQSLLQKAVTHNSELLQDEHIQELIYKECKAKFKSAKIGKILCSGNYQFLVSDPVAQIQAIIKNSAVDGNVKDLKVEGLVTANQVYSNYWTQDRCITLSDGSKKYYHVNIDAITLMRSPLIDQSEIAVRTLVNNEDTRNWYQYIQSGIVLSIWDLTTLQLQNCDFDGDRVFSSNNHILKNGALPNPLPLLYPTATTLKVGEIVETNLIKADNRGLNSKVGSLSNKSASFYAKLANYSIDSKEYYELLNRIKILGELVGVEIDKIKTGIAPKTPTDWQWKKDKTKAIEKDGKNVTVSELTAEQQLERDKHNALVPCEKPYFMRYIYNQLDREINTFTTSLNKESLFNYRKKLQILLDTPEEALSKKEQYTIKKYQRGYPANDSDCTMNLICHKFEILENRLKRQLITKSMLPDFATEQKFDKEVMSGIQRLLAMYTKQRKFLTQKNNSGNIKTGTNIAKQNHELLGILYEHIKKEILELCNDDIQTAFNYMVRAVLMKNGKYDFVWNVLDESILEVIPDKPFKNKVEQSEGE